MNKTEFINKLEKKLKYISKEDREDAICFYKEYIEDMGLDDNEDVTSKIGNPSQIAAGIIAESTEKEIENNKNDKKLKTSTKILLLVLIAVFSIPVLIPLGIMLIVLILTLLFVAFIFICVSISTLVSAFVISGIGQKLVCLGVSFLMLSISLIIIFAIYGLVILFVKLIIKLVKKNSKKGEE